MEVTDAGIVKDSCCFSAAEKEQAEDVIQRAVSPDREAGRGGGHKMEGNLLVASKVRELNIDDILRDLEIISNELMRKKGDEVGFNDTAIRMIKMVAKDFVDLLG